MSAKELKLLSQTINPILKQYSVSFAALFGSRAKGGAKKDSDYDILIDYPPKSDFSLLDLVGLQQDLKKKLKTDVDVVTKNGLSPYFKKEVLSNMKVLYDISKG
jgi:hypothetical protein